MPKSRSRFSLLGEQPPREPKPVRPFDKTQQTTNIWLDEIR